MFGNESNINRINKSLGNSKKVDKMFLRGKFSHMVNRCYQNPRNKNKNFRVEHKRVREINKDPRDYKFS